MTIQLRPRMKSIRGNPIAPSGMTARAYARSLLNLIRPMLVKNKKRFQQLLKGTVFTEKKREALSEWIAERISKLEATGNKEQISRLEKWAKNLSVVFAREIDRNVRGSLSGNRGKRGIPGINQWEFSPEVESEMEAIIAENVALIRDLPLAYYGKIQKAVMDTQVSGNDARTLYNRLMELGGITERRAKLIAHDQTVKASSALARKRSIQAGIKKGVWRHSHAGKKPRPSHRYDADGKEFDLEKGMYLLDDKTGLKRWQQPGQEIGCRCFYTPILEEPA
jgi:uncharacterized protein with gpF-like domain